MMRTARPRFSWTLLFVVLLAAVLAARYACAYYEHTETAHFLSVVSTIAQILDGESQLSGPQISTTGLTPGGAFYYRLSALAMALGPPVPGTLRLYFLMEWMAIACWIGCCSRAGVRSTVLWAGALLMAVFWEPKYRILENMTVAMHFSVALFGVGLVAVRSRGWVWMLPTALLLGFTYLIHTAALCLVAPIYLSAILAPGPRVKRVMALTCGLLPFVAYTAVQTSGSSREVGDVVETLSAVGVVSMFTDLAGSYRAYPLAVAGLLLVLLRPLRGLFFHPTDGDSAGPEGREKPAIRWLNALGPGEILAVSWFVVVLVALTWAIAVATPGIVGDYRYGMHIPARAFLGGTIIAWSLDLVGRGLERTFHVRLQSKAILALTSLVVLLVLLARTSTSREQFEMEYQAVTDDRCGWHVFDYTDCRARYMARFHRDIDSADVWPIAALGGAEQLMLGYFDFWRESSWFGRPSRPPRGSSSAAPQENSTWAITARMEGVEIRDLPDAKDMGPFTAIRVGEALALDVRPDSPPGWKTYDVATGGIATAADGLVLLAITGSPVLQVPDTPQLRRGAALIEPIAGCECRDRSGEGPNYHAWLLFDVTERGPDVAPIELAVRHEGDFEAALWPCAGRP